MRQPGRKLETMSNILESEAPTTLKRLRSILAEVPEHCEYGEQLHCRERLQTAIDRFCAFDEIRQRRRQLAAARDHKEQIEAILGFLGDLDELSEGEIDRSVFEEMALLFIDISRLGQSGAAILRSLGGAPEPDRPRSPPRRRQSARILKAPAK